MHRSRRPKYADTVPNPPQSAATVSPLATPIGRTHDPDGTPPAAVRDARALGPLEARGRFLDLCGGKGRAHGRSASTGLRRIPTPETSTSTTSPGPRKRGGSKRMPAPTGVPVEMMSPGSSTVNVDR